MEPALISLGLLAIRTSLLEETWTSGCLGERRILNPSGDRISTPRKDLYPRGGLSTPQGLVLYPRDRLSTPRRDLYPLGDSLPSPRENLYPGNNHSTPRRLLNPRYDPSTPRHVRRLTDRDFNPRRRIYPRRRTRMTPSLERRGPTQDPELWHQMMRSIQQLDSIWSSSRIDMMRSEGDMQ